MADILMDILLSALATALAALVLNAVKRADRLIRP